MARLSDMSPEDRRQFIYDAYCNAVDCYDSESGDPHPSHTVRAWYRASASGASPDAPTRIEGEDDVQPSESERGQAGAVPAQDGRYTVDSANVPRFEFVDAKGDVVKVVTGDAAIEARARQSDPRKVRRMSAKIAGYDRIR